MSTPATTRTPAVTSTGLAAAPARPGTLTVVRWEVAKLTAQARTRYTLLGCLLAPVLVVLVVHAQQQTPKDTIYGRHVHASGFAMPLLMLAFC
ncbi:MAG: type transport system permease protein, partial [Cryptosporangiaceae bacterium]|nr:type transport system permease protein [Cryptosporangiaceae bacterium]